MNKHKKEYIGKKLRILKTKNEQQKDMTGIITKETKYTFTIKNEKERIILKKDKEFLIEQDKIQGNKILKKPEERIKIKKE